VSEGAYVILLFSIEKREEIDICLQIMFMREMRDRNKKINY